MKRVNKIVKVNPASPEPDTIRAAAEIVEHGGIVVFPTRCLYGLAANSLDPKAVERIYRIKMRPGIKPILVLIENEDALGKIVSEIGPKTRVLMEKFWPGNVTILFPALPCLPDALTGGTGKIGVRLPAHPAASALAKACKNPITGTSANLSGQPGCADIRDLPPEILREVDSVLDAGPLAGGAGSTVVDATGPAPRVLREGKIAASDIFAALEKN